MTLSPARKTLLANISLLILPLIAIFAAAELWLRYREGGEATLREPRYVDTGGLPCSWTHADHRGLLEKFEAGDAGRGKALVLLGDSVMASLDQGPRAPGAGGLAVYNFGVDGYDLQQTVLYLKYLLARKTPDMIVIGICINDIMPYHAQMLYQVKTFGPVYAALGPLRHSAVLTKLVRACLRYGMANYAGTPDCLRERDGLAQKAYRGTGSADAALVESRKKAEAALGPSWPHLFLFDEYADPEKYFIHIAAPLAELARMGITEKVRIVVWPADAGVEPYWLEPVRGKIENEARRHGFLTIDLMEAYKTGCRDKCFVPDRIHFTTYGRELFLNGIIGSLQLHREGARTGGKTLPGFTGNAPVEEK